MTTLIEQRPLSQAPAPARTGPWALEIRALAALAAPLVLTQLAQMAVMTTDVLLLGRFSKTALASAAIGNTVFYFAWLLGGGPASAVSPMIAQAQGVRLTDKASVRAALRMGLWAVAMVSVPMMGFLLLAGPILLALGQKPELAAGAGKFVAMLALGLPFSLGFRVFSNFTTALGKPRAALWVMAATIAFNALAGWALIFGHLGAPRLGIAGSGLATAASSAFSCLAMVAVIQLTPELRAYRMFRRFQRPARAKLAEVFRLGLPIGVTMIFEAMLFNTMTLVMGTFGTTPVAAHQIAMNVASITFMIPLGLGMAATVRVGIAAGGGDIHGARRAGVAAMGVAVGFIALCGAAMALFGRQIAGLYFGSGSATDADVIVLAARFLQVAAAFQVFDALQVVGALSLRGLKDARAPMVIAGASYWLVGAPLCLLLGLGLHMGGMGIWIGLAVALAAAAAGMIGRFWMLVRD